MGLRGNIVRFSSNTTSSKKTRLSTSSAIPYTYSQLQKFIADIKQNPSVSTSKLSETLGGLEVPLVTITNTPLNETTFDLNGTPPLKKKVVLIGGRIHPGEPNSSYVL